jgi:hypothetical protein
MHSSREERLLRSLCGLYGLMLRAYMRSFRLEYGREMMLVFRDRAHDVQCENSWALLPFMFRILSEWVTTVPCEREVSMSLTRAARLSIVLGIGSLLAVVVSHLALTDIYHGGTDLTVEWNVLRMCFAVMIAFQVTALLTLRRVLRDSGRRELHVAE